MKRIELIEFLSPVDKNFWNLETPSTRQVIGSLTLHKQEISHTAVIAGIQKILPQFPRLKGYIQGFFRPAFYQEWDFNIQRHVIVRDLVADTTLETLKSAVEEEFSKPLDRTLSPWKFVIFRHPKGSKLTLPHVALFCFHHSLVDGMGAITLINALTSASSTSHSPDSNSPPEMGSPNAVVPRSAEHPSSLKKVLQYAQLKRPTEFLSGTNSSKRRIAFRSFPTQSIHALKRSGPFTANDILLTAVARAHAHLAIQFNYKETPKEIRIIMPVSLRKKQNLTSLGNQLTAIALPIPVTLSDTRKHLHAVSHICQMLKNDDAIQAYSYLARFNSKFPPPIQRLLCQKQAKRTNLICTNMVHSSELLSYGDSPILEHYGLPALLHEQGVAFSFITYAKQTCVSLVSDANILPEPEMLLNCFFQGLEELIQSVAGTRTVTSAVGGAEA